MNRKSILRIAMMLALLQGLELVPGVIATANAAWTSLGLFWVGTSWGHLVLHYKFVCRTTHHGTYVYESPYSEFGLAAVDATKHCK